MNLVDFLKETFDPHKMVADLQANGFKDEPCPAHGASCFGHFPCGGCGFGGAKLLKKETDSARFASAVCPKCGSQEDIVHLK